MPLLVAAAGAAWAGAPDGAAAFRRGEGLSAGIAGTSLVLRDRAVACAGCHGVDGRGPFPASEGGQPIPPINAAALSRPTAVRPGYDAASFARALTEGVASDDPERAVEIMADLHARGVRMSIDDFGTGYSSLSYLKRLPLDQIKIDQGFVHDVMLDPKDAAIAHTIIALANMLGLGVIAEGVETPEHHRFLMEHGCRAFQGYLFGRPEPLELFEQRVRAQHS